MGIAAAVLVAPALAAATAVAAPLANQPQPSSPTAGAAYGGSTAQKYAVSFRVSDGGGRIRGLTVRLKGRCDSGRGYATNFSQGTGRIRVSEDGSFFGQTAIKGSGLVIDSGTARVQGRFYDDGKLARGKVSQSVNLTNGDKCRTGEVSFSATTGD